MHPLGYLGLGALVVLVLGIIFSPKFRRVFLDYFNF